MGTEPVVADEVRQALPDEPPLGPAEDRVLAHVRECTDQSKSSSKKLLRFLG